MSHLLTGVRNCGDYERAWIFQSPFSLDMGKSEDEMGYIVFDFELPYALDSPLDFLLECTHLALPNIQEQAAWPASSRTRKSAAFIVIVDFLQTIFGHGIAVVVDFHYVNAGDFPVPFDQSKVALTLHYVSDEAFLRFDLS